jgi:hypothetical protein
MARVMIRTIIIGAELSFLMAARWTHDALRSTGNRSKTMSHSPAIRGTRPPFGLWPSRIGLDLLTKTCRRSVICSGLLLI